MTRTAMFLMAAALSAPPVALFGQSQSPDQQQGQNKNPDTKPTPPHGDQGNPHNGQSPDIQQQKNSNDKTYKSGTTSRQAHGKPKPKSDTATSH